MAPGGRARAPYIGLGLVVILLAAAELVPGEDVLSQAAFVMKAAAGEAEGPGGEYLFDFDGDEIFHVDLEQKKTVWRRPEFGQFSTFQAEGALGNMALLRTNLEKLIKRSNGTPAENDPPRVLVYPERPAELGEPNVLICQASGFSPPSGQTHVAEERPSGDGAGGGDGLLPFPAGPLLPQVLLPDLPSLRRGGRLPLPGGAPGAGSGPGEEVSSTCHSPENVVCGLGLAVGIAGIILGTALALRSRQKEEGNYRRGPL